MNTLLEIPSRTAQSGDPRFEGRAPLVAGVVGLVGCCLFLVTTDAFLTRGTMQTVLSYTAIVGLVALGQLLIMTSGSFASLSLGTITAVSAITFLSLADDGIVVALTVTLLLAGLISGAQGYAVGAWGADPIVVTIGAAAVIQGAVLSITDVTVKAPHTAAVDRLASPIWGVDAAFFVLIALAALVHAVLTRTPFGALISLVGDNRQAATVASLPVVGTLVGVFTLAGICAGVAGIMLGAAQGSASLSVEGTIVFDALVATLIGATRVTGGRGSALRVLSGTVLVSAVSTCLLLRGFGPGVQLSVRGVILLIAVLSIHALGSGPRFGREGSKS